jgi:hypothetical protein
MNKNASTKDKRIHGKWDIVGTEDVYFIYRCRKCGGKVKSGVPFSQQNMTTCT